MGSGLGCGWLGRLRATWASLFPALWLGLSGCGGERLPVEPPAAPIETAPPAQLGESASAVFDAGPLAERGVVPDGVEAQLSVDTGFGGGGGCADCWVDFLFPPGRWTFSGYGEPWYGPYQTFQAVDFCFPDSPYDSPIRIEVRTPNGDRLPIDTSPPATSVVTFTNATSGEVHWGSCFLHELLPGHGVGTNAITATRDGQSDSRHIEVESPGFAQIMLRPVGAGRDQSEHEVARGQTVRAYLAGYPPGPVAIHIYRPAGPSIAPGSTPTESAGLILRYVNSLDGKSVGPDGEAVIEIPTRLSDQPDTYFVVTDPPDVLEGGLSYFELR